jgi:nucleoside recognition membrane protein YjiH
LLPASLLSAQTIPSPSHSIFIAISLFLLHLMLFCFLWTKCMLGCVNLTRSLTRACGDLIGLAELMVQQIPPHISRGEQFWAIRLEPYLDFWVCVFFLSSTFLPFI